MCAVHNLDLYSAVASRFQAIRGGLKPKTGDVIYEGGRTAPSELGWRFRQSVLGWIGATVPADMPKAVLEGKFDAEIEATWHDAARAQHWYTYEKQWH
jgi:hypothetical protein